MYARVYSISIMVRCGPRCSTIKNNLYINIYIFFSKVLNGETRCAREHFLFFNSYTVLLVLFNRQITRPSVVQSPSEFMCDELWVHCILWPRGVNTDIPSPSNSYVNKYLKKNSPVFEGKTVVRYLVVYIIRSSSLHSSFISLLFGTK